MFQKFRGLLFVVNPTENRFYSVDTSQLQRSLEPSGTPFSTTQVHTNERMPNAIWTWGDKLTYGKRGPQSAQDFKVWSFPLEQ
jgi:hypothetical protein